MRENESEFWEALQAEGYSRFRQLLEQDASLAGQNFRPDSLHTDGFPLYQAARQGNEAMVATLLEFGAHPDAALETDDPRELGMPILFAFEKQNFSLAHRLLDHGASLNAHGYCSTPLVDLAFNAMWNETADCDHKNKWNYREGSEKLVDQLFWQAFRRYLGNDTLEEDTKGSERGFVHNETVSIPDTLRGNETSYESLRFLIRLIQSGGQPSLFTLVRHRRYPLIRKLLQENADASGTEMDWPRGTVFDNIVHGASWCGYPETLRDGLAICVQQYQPDVARRAIENAIRSHNRDGTADDYYGLIADQLEFLNQRGVAREAYSSGEPFLPLHWLAEDFIEPSHYGFKCESLLNSKDQIRFAQLFLQFGHTIDAINPKTGRSVLQTATHEGALEYAEFLQAAGVDAK